MDFLRSRQGHIQIRNERIALMKASIFKRGVFSRFLSPERIFVLSFAALIFAGAFLLWASFSGAKKPLSFVDALFTSASAVCVTGLASIDIGKDLSFAGQIVTIFLFQIGGLGIITFSTFFLVLIGRGVSVKERDILQSSFLYTPQRDFLSLVKSIIIFALSANGWRNDWLVLLRNSALLKNIRQCIVGGGCRMTITGNILLLVSV